MYKQTVPTVGQVIYRNKFSITYSDMFVLKYLSMCLTAQQSRDEKEEL